MGSCVIIAYRAALDYHTARDTVRKATDWDAVIQEGKVVIFNLNEAILGTEEIRLFGIAALLNTKPSQNVCSITRLQGWNSPNRRLGGDPA